MQHCFEFDFYLLEKCSGEQDITNLIISDLYYHIHGELEGRPITPGPFQELLCFLLEFKVFEHNPSEQLQKSFPAANGVSLFDVPHIRDELGLELWNHSDWKTYKEVAEKMLDIMHKANLMKCQVDAKLCALRSFITFLSVCTGTVSLYILRSLLLLLTLVLCTVFYFHLSLLNYMFLNMLKSSLQFHQLPLVCHGILF